MSVIFKDEYVYAGTNDILVQAPSGALVVDGLAFSMAFDTLASTDIVIITIQIPNTISSSARTYGVEIFPQIDSNYPSGYTGVATQYAGGKAITDTRIRFAVSGYAAGTHTLTMDRYLNGNGSGTLYLPCDGDIPFKVSIVVVPGA